MFLVEKIRMFCTTQMLMLISIRDTVSIPVGIAHTTPSRVSDTVKADIPMLPMFWRIR